MTYNTYLISQIDESLANEGAKMSEDQKKQTQQIRDELKTALDNNDIETLKNNLKLIKIPNI